MFRTTRSSGIVAMLKRGRDDAIADASAYASAAASAAAIAARATSEAASAAAAVVAHNAIETAAAIAAYEVASDAAAVAASRAAAARVASASSEAASNVAAAAATAAVVVAQNAAICASAATAAAAAAATASAATSATGSDGAAYAQMPPLSVLPTVVPVAHELLMCTVCFDLPEGIVNQVAAFAAHSTVLACSHLVTYAHTHTRPRMASVYHYLHHPPPFHVSQCASGHIICSKCLRAHIGSGRGAASCMCPTCRVEFGKQPIRNLLAEAIIVIGYRHGNCEGCGISMLRKDLVAHRQDCAAAVLLHAEIGAAMAVFGARTAGRGRVEGEPMNSYHPTEPSDSEDEVVYEAYRPTEPM